MLTIFLVNLNTHWAYKDCQFNNCFLVKIVGSFPFGAVVQSEEIFKALASVVAMVITCKYFKFPCHSPPPLFFINSLFSPGEDHSSACLTNHALWTSFSQPRSSRSAVWCIETCKHTYTMSASSCILFICRIVVAWQYVMEFLYDV